MSMIERVAGAIAAASGQEWADCGVGYRQICTSFAIAAIKAMREPTDEMCLAANEAIDNPPYFDTYVARDSWQAMIDAALTDTEKR